MFYRVRCLLPSNLSLVNSATVLLSLQLDIVFEAVKQLDWIQLDDAKHFPLLWLL